MSENSGPASRILGRIMVVIILITSLIASALTREWAIDRHASATNGGRISSEAGSGSQASSLNGMPAFATALLLGGLRGPLVMILWTTSETQKQQHQLEDIDTKIEWIRLLQPEFDQVHLFQIWNKAYNISVLMADQSNKYTTILDAIDYGQKVDRGRPDDINIIGALAGIYDNKLGRAQEHPYYRFMVRKESQTRYRVKFPESRESEFRTQATKLGWTELASPLIDNKRTGEMSLLLERPLVIALRPNFAGSDVQYDVETRRDLRTNDPSWRRLRLEPVVDINGSIFADLLKPNYPQPDGSDAYDGSQLQYLKKYQPFPYGVSTLALGYSEYKRAQILQRDWKERDIQNSETVVNSRPAICQKEWAMDEWDRGRRAELRMWGNAVPNATDPAELEMPSASVPFITPSKDALSHDLAAYSYKLAARLMHDARGEFEAHDKAYPYTALTYRVHIEDTITGEHMMQADYDYLAAATATGAEREALIKDAISEYTACAENASKTVLKFYFPTPITSRTYPMKSMTEHYSQSDIETSDHKLWIDTFEKAQELARRDATDEAGYHPGRDEHSEDRVIYGAYVGRALMRINILEGKAPTTQPAAENLIDVHPH